ncbi:hypothetical protein [Kribbella sp. CA-247076]|uniref:hypothetical protein n=1 Tax=Kribbella sp. CA-247076 TaxID=3239941 RepID=UPI003D92B92E
MNAVEMIAIIALVGYALYRQTRVNEVTGRGRFKLAVIYTAAGVLSGVHVAHNRTAYGLLAVSLVASLVTGLLRGRRTRMWAADGRIYTRGTVATVGLFLGLVAFKFALGTFAYLTHTPYESGIGSVLVMVGVMLAVQAELIWRRAGALRTPAPDGLHAAA